jgi:hypothetical protein
MNEKEVQRIGRSDVATIDVKQLLGKREATNSRRLDGKPGPAMNVPPTAQIEGQTSAVNTGRIEGELQFWRADGTPTGKRVPFKGKAIRLGPGPEEQPKPEGGNENGV